MKIKNVLSFILFLPTIAFGQDLLRNGGFEKYLELPDAGSQWFKCKSWNELKKSNNKVYSDPEFYHDDGFSVSNYYSGYVDIDVKKGKGIMGFHPTGIPPISPPNSKMSREYLSTMMSETMKIHSDYIISFWLSNGIPIWSNLGLSCNDIGILFSTNQLTQNKFSVIERKPQLVVKGDVWNTEWTKYTFQFTSDSAYKYLSFGNFYVDSLVQLESHVAFYATAAYYFVDDFSVLPGWLYVVGDTTICKGNEATLKAFNDKDHRWALATEPGTIILEDSILKISPSITTTYVVYGIKDTAYFTVYVKDVGQFELGNDTTICEGESFVLEPSFSGANFTWSNGSTRDRLLISNSGKYVVRADKEGCIYFDSLIVNFKHCDCNISIPNAFTPNGDGLNDVFFVQFDCSVKSYNLAIYNRWGDEVFKSMESKFGWDGSYGGKSVPSGIYVYRLEYELANGTFSSATGKIMVP